MLQNLSDGSIVCDKHTLKSHNIPQNCLQHIFMTGQRQGFELIEGRHSRQSSCLDRSMIRPQILIEHLLTAHINGIVITSGLRSSVKCEMLYASRDVSRLIQIALKTSHLGSCNFSSKIRVLTGSFRNSAPARVAGNVAHRGEGPGNTVPACFLTGNLTSLSDGLKVPGRSHCQRYREAGLISVNHIQSENKGNSESGLFDCNFLHCSNRLSSCVEYASNLSCTNFCLNSGICNGSCENIANQLVHLSDFLLQSHLRHQGVDAEIFLRKARNHCQA